MEKITEFEGASQGEGGFREGGNLHRLVGKVTSFVGALRKLLSPEPGASAAL